MQYVNAFIAGGLICVIGQILLDKTKLTLLTYRDVSDEDAYALGARWMSVRSFAR